MVRFLPLFLPSPSPALSSPPPPPAPWFCSFCGSFCGFFLSFFLSFFSVASCVRSVVSCHLLWLRFGSCLALFVALRAPTSFRDLEVSGTPGWYWTQHRRLCLLSFSVSSVPLGQFWIISAQTFGVYYRVFGLLFRHTPWKAPSPSVPSALYVLVSARPYCRRLRNPFVCSGLRCQELLLPVCFFLARDGLVGSPVDVPSHSWMD